MTLKSELIHNLKNSFGWKSNRKLVAICVDDYGNVRVNSSNALSNVEKEGIKIDSRFDALDTLETKQDLEMLYDALLSVKDKNAQPAIFTPYALSCNINFKAMAEEGYTKYISERLPDTYESLASSQPKAYEGAWSLWREGINMGIMSPQFHGREHVNLKLFNEQLAERDSALMASLKNSSLMSLNPSKHATIGWTSAFSFWDPIKDTSDFEEIVRSGLLAFEEVFGVKPIIFTPPAQQIAIELEEKLADLGLKAIDKPFFQKKHLGFSKYQTKVTGLGYNKKTRLVQIVRNVVFEPTDGNMDHVGQALSQIETAFRWNKPALISSHRVNFCGHIDEKNRDRGITSLKELLNQIVTRWPDVEFIGAHQLVELIR